MVNYTLVNLLPNPSFEQNASWSGAHYDTAQHKYGGRSNRFPVGGTFVTACPMPKPVVGHKYYGRMWYKTAGNNAPADCRFEWFAGDGAGLNFVFAWNRGDYPDWGMQSSIIHVTAVNGASYVCRTFVVNATVESWTDGLLIVDLTAAFGAGNEPDQAWCDAHIPFFEGTMALEAYPFHALTVDAAVLTPNPASINQPVSVRASVREEHALLLPESWYAGEIFTGEV